MLSSVLPIASGCTAVTPVSLLVNILSVPAVEEIIVPRLSEENKMEQVNKKRMTATEIYIITFIFSLME